jgi:hypothetical protein
MGRRRTSARAAALRQAREAKALRDAERLVREQRIEAALADYFESAGRAGQIRADGQRRAEKVIADAEASAAESDVAARRAIRKLRDLEQTNAEIAGLCGLSVMAVRAMASGVGGAKPGMAASGSAG